MDKVVDGLPVNIDDYPFLAVLFINLNSSSVMCGGSYLGNNWILTAAHCVVAAVGVTAFFGVDHLGDVFSWQAMHTESTEIVVHESFNPTTLSHDIAMIRVDEFSAPPAASLSKNPEKAERVGSHATVLGYGATEYMQAITPSGKLLRADVVMMKPPIKDPTMLFAEGDRVVDGEVADTCQGDSGGPLLDGEGRLLGITSWGIECGRPGHPGAYSRISVFRDWIHKWLGTDVR